MFCPRCGGEYRSGFTTCADCGVALVRELEAGWEAESEAEDSGPLALLETTSSPDRLGELTARLEAAEVPYVVQAGTALALLDDLETWLPPAGSAWEARLWVASQRLAEAKTLRDDLDAELGDTKQRAGLGLPETGGVGE